jgi:hypothetical protein
LNAEVPNVSMTAQAHKPCRLLLNPELELFITLPRFLAGKVYRLSPASMRDFFTGESQVLTSGNYTLGYRWKFPLGSIAFA